jgi:hypothetical protein
MADGTRFFLLDNPPATQQFHPSRNAPLTGGVLLHTTESIMDNVGPDTGAENVAGFISRRGDYGSYHTIVDADSTVRLMPDTYTAFHCAASGYNSRTFGLSFACRTADLNPDDPWTQAAFKRAAAELVRFWTENGFDPAAVARFVPAEATKSGPGLSTHGDAQPADRSDAFTRHPRRGDLERLLLNEIAALLSPPAPPGVDPTMNKPVMMRRKTDGTISVFYTGTPFRYDCRPKDVDVFRFFGVEYKGDVDPWFWETSQAIKAG